MFLLTWSICVLLHFIIVDAQVFKKKQKRQKSEHLYKLIWIYSMHSSRYSVLNISLSFLSKSNISVVIKVQTLI